METKATYFLAVGTAAVAFMLAYGVAVGPHYSFAPPQSAQGLLDKADRLAWVNKWAEAKPIYAQGAKLFAQEGQTSKALYAAVSEVPADESSNIPAKILYLTKALAMPEAQIAETKLRILTIRGMLETNYDAGAALTTWQQVESLALKRGDLRLSTRAGGEQGIAAFILGDTVTAKSKVLRAWGLSEVEHDPAATVRYASIYGAGLVQIHRYKEALTPLDKAIFLAKSNADVAYPTIAVYAKIDALAGLHDYSQARQLADESLKRLEGTPYEGHKAQVLISRGSIERQQGDLNTAVEDYQNAVAISKRIDNYRGIVDGDGELAVAYEEQNKFPEALKAIDSAISANTAIPDELYLVPRNLAIKADIVGRIGHTDQAADLYRKAITLVNRMIQHAPTTNVQRQLLAEMSDVYSGYFAALCTQKKYDEALRILDNVRGRVEAEALQHHESQTVREATDEDKRLTQLNLSLINTEDPSARASIANAIYNTEVFMTPSIIARETVTRPVALAELQKALGPNALLIEYVLAEPASYVLAITHESVKHYQLISKQEIETDANLYRKEIRSQKNDGPLAHKLFSELLAPIPEYRNKSDLIVIPDGSLHLLPFAALQDEHGFVLASHTVNVDPSATVYALLHKRIDKAQGSSTPYVGVAAGLPDLLYQWDC